jgi:hypothetical protein
MPLHSAIRRHPRFSRWLERLSDVGPRADPYRDGEQRPEQSLERRRNDDEPQTWAAGYTAFWRDLAAAWLVAALIAGVVFVIQSADNFPPSNAPGAATAQAPQSGKAARIPVRSNRGAGECTDLDNAYGRC